MYPRGWQPPRRAPARARRHRPGAADHSPASSSSPIWERLAAFVCDQVQRFIRAVLEEAMTALLGRPKSARRTAVDASPGMRNGDGKPRRLSPTSGTITVRRPRVCRLGERFVRRVLPLFQRRTRQVGEWLPQLSLHGLALRGLLGEGAPRSAASLARLQATWPLAYEAWKQRRLDDLAVVYVWSDGWYINAGLAEGNAALLVLIGALTNGQSVVLAVESGPRESQASWGAVLRALRALGPQALARSHRRRPPRHLGSRGGAATDGGRATVLEPSPHQCVGCHSQKEPAPARTLWCAMPYAES